MTYSSSLAMEVVTHGIPTLDDVQYIDLQKICGIQLDIYDTQQVHVFFTRML